MERPRARGPQGNPRALRDIAVRARTAAARRRRVRGRGASHAQPVVLRVARARPVRQGGRRCDMGRCGPRLRGDHHAGALRHAFPAERLGGGERLQCRRPCGRQAAALWLRRDPYSTLRCGRGAFHSGAAGGRLVALADRAAPLDPGVGRRGDRRGGELCALQRRRGNRGAADRIDSAGGAGQRLLQRIVADAGAGWSRRACNRG